MERKTHREITNIKQNKRVSNLRPHPRLLLVQPRMQHLHRDRPHPRRLSNRLPRHRKVKNRIRILDHTDLIADMEQCHRNSILHARVGLFLPYAHGRRHPLNDLVEHEFAEVPGEGSLPEVENPDEEEFTVGDGFGGETFSFRTEGGSSECTGGVDLGATDSTVLIE